MAAADKMLKLKSQDGKFFSVPESVAKQSVTISHLLEDLDDNSEDPIPIPNVDALILQKVIDYMEAHKSDAPLTEEQQAEQRGKEIVGWDATFVDCKTPEGKSDMPTIFKLILAANFLDIKPLLDLMCKAVAFLVKGKSNEEIRLLFGITTDFTEEEQTKVRLENPWCDDTLPAQEPAAPAPPLVTAL